MGDLEAMAADRLCAGMVQVSGRRHLFFSVLGGAWTRPSLVSSFVHVAVIKQPHVLQSRLSEPLLWYGRSLPGEAPDPLEVEEWTDSPSLGPSPSVRLSVEPGFQPRFLSQWCPQSSAVRDALLLPFLSFLPSTRVLCTFEGSTSHSFIHSVPF